MKLEAENLGIPSDDDDEKFADEEMVKKKERDIEDVRLRKVVEEVVSTCIGKTGHADTTCIADMLADQERLSLSESKLKRIEASVDELTEDSLKVSRRILKIGNDLKQVEKDIVGIKKDIVLMKDRAKIIKELSDQYEVKKDSKWESTRDTILRVSVIVISAAAVIASIWNYLRGG